MAKPEHPVKRRTRKRNQMTARRYRVLEAHLGGASEREIARKEGITPSTAHEDLKTSLELLAKRHMGMADEVRGVQMERYTKLFMTWWPQALQGDSDATNQVLRIMERMDKINGVIPDRPMITLQQNNMNINSAPVTFHIESANDNSGDQISEAPSIS